MTNKRTSQPPAVSNLVLRQGPPVALGDEAITQRRLLLDSRAPRTWANRFGRVR
jgi:hypothetical protein